jgi:hypothetical protein
MAQWVVPAEIGKKIGQTVVKTYEIIKKTSVTVVKIAGMPNMTGDVVIV